MPGSDTLHTVWFWGGLLGIVCRTCDHRAVLTRETLPAISRGNMTSLRSLTLKCKSCGVSGKGPEFWTMFLLSDEEQAAGFLRGFESFKRAMV